MLIESIDVYLVRLPLITPFNTSYGDTDVIESVLVRLTSEGQEGWGEATAWAAPNYCPEYAGGVFDVIQRFLGPAVLGRTFEDAETLQAAMRPFKGNPFAKSALDTAWWDLFAKMQGQPLWRVLGGNGPTVDVGADFGVMESIDALLQCIDGAVRQGFKRIKLKFRPGWDVDMVAAVRRTFPDVVFHIDCNSAYTLADAAMFETLDAYNLAMIEQPLGYDDLVDHAELQRRIRTPICLDESITSPSKARKAIELGAARWINVKPGRVGGLTPAKEILALCERAGVPCWIGGMLESNIGAAHCLALATLPNVKYPSDVFPSDRFYKHDLADPPTVLSGPSQITAVDGPGIGVRVAMDRLRAATIRHVTQRANNRTRVPVSRTTTASVDTETFRIEQASRDDFLEIAELDRLTWHESFIADGEHTWRIWCEHATVLTARDSKDNALIGVLLCFPGERDTDVLHKIFVHPDHRGRGVGSSLMRVFLQNAQRPVLLTCDPQNTPALHTYERFGFQRAALIEGYYRPNEHRYEMRWEPR